MTHTIVSEPEAGWTQIRGRVEDLNLDWSMFVKDVPEKMTIHISREEGARLFEFDSCEVDEEVWMSRLFVTSDDGLWPFELPEKIKLEWKGKAA